MQSLRKFNLSVLSIFQLLVLSRGYDGYAILCGLASR